MYPKPFYYLVRCISAAHQVFPIPSCPFHFFLHPFLPLFPFPSIHSNPIFFLSSGQLLVRHDPHDSKSKFVIHGPSIDQPLLVLLDWLRINLRCCFGECRKTNWASLSCRRSLVFPRGCMSMVPYIRGYQVMLPRIFTNSWCVRVVQRPPPFLRLSL